MVILCRRPDHRWAADVDIFDDLFMFGARLRHGLLERVEIDDHQIDVAEPLLLDDRLMPRVVADGEDARVDAWVQGLDAAVENLGKACYLADVADGEPGLGEGLARAAGRDQFDAEARQAAGELDQAGFVADAEQGAGNLAEGHRSRFRGGAGHTVEYMNR